jgi:hypothetical protein
MTQKKLLRPDRVRQVPEHFRWIDHRLIRQHRLRDCQHGAWALYLFLASVGDAQGLSYYSEASLMRALKLDSFALAGCRRQLVEADLIAYEKPLYQVLNLADTPDTGLPARGGQARCVADILRQAMGGVA